MERYKRIVDPVLATELTGDGQLRSFALDELDMTAQQVNADIASAVLEEIYPEVRLSSDPMLTVRVGWYVMRDDNGEWATASPLDFERHFERTNPGSGPTPL